MLSWQTCSRLEASPKAVWCDELINSDRTEFLFEAPDEHGSIQAVVSYFDDARVVESKDELSDCLTTLSGTLTLSARAAQLLHQLTLHDEIKECPTEILNERGDKLADWSTFFARRSHDALDLGGSVVEMAESSRTVVQVHSWSFDPEKLPQADFFLSPPLEWIASERMRKAFRRHSIKGLRFVPIWSAANGTIAQEEIERLFEIDLRNTPIHDEGLSNLRHATNLRNLNAQGTPITDSGLRHLVRLPRLSALRLGDTAVGDSTLEAFREAPSISLLSLPRTKITDSGLVSLKEYPRLRIVDVEGTIVSDAGAEALCQLGRLHRVNIRNSRVSDVGIDRIAETFPNCEIIR